MFYLFCHRDISPLLLRTQELRITMTIERLKIDEYFSSSDLSLVTTISLWFPIAAIDKSQSLHKVVFLFERDKNLEKCVESYWRKELRVEPQTYFQQLRLIKTRIYENE